MRCTHTLLPLLPLLMTACGASAEEEGGCEDYPSEATAPGGTLDRLDDCGHWSLAVGEHIYINVEVTAADTPCTGTVTGAVILPYEPIYSNLSDDAAKWTFDVEGTEAGEGSLSVTCEDGTTWGALFAVAS